MNIKQYPPLSWDSGVSPDPDPSSTFAVPMSADRLQELQAQQVPSYAASNIKYSPWSGWHAHMRTLRDRCSAGVALFQHFTRRTEDMRNINLDLFHSGGWALPDYDNKFYRRIHLHGRNSSFESRGVFLARDQEHYGSHSIYKLSDGTEPNDDRILRSEVLAAIRLSADVLARDLTNKDQVLKYSIYPTMVVSTSACHVRILQIHVDLMRDIVVVRKTPFMHIRSREDDDKIRLVLRWYLGRPTGQTQWTAPPVSMVGSSYMHATDPLTVEGALASKASRMHITALA